MVENNSFVVDASFVLAFLLPDESKNNVEEIFKKYYLRKINLYAPSLLPFEIANSLRTAVLRKRINKAAAEDLLQHFLDLDIIYKEINYTFALKIALENQLNVYDASYVWLARNEKVKLLSLDNSLMSLS